MKALPVAHIGILVADLESARERWSRALGAPFSPITRYRPSNWSDLGNPEPHLHDARLTFCLGDNPSIEILEFVGNGTHAPSKGEGGHHISFPPIPDNAKRRAELAALGVGIDGEIRHDDRWIFMFSDADALNNVYAEWVEECPDHPDVKDDLSPVNRLPDGSKTLFDVDTILGLGGRRPFSGITEIGVRVRDIDAAVQAWTSITGYDFDESRSPVGVLPGSEHEQRSQLSRQHGPRVRLVHTTQDQGREGLHYAVIGVADLHPVSRRLAAEGVPVSKTARDPRGQLARVDVDPAFLNGFTIRFEKTLSP